MLCSHSKNAITQHERHCNGAVKMHPLSQTKVFHITCSVTTVVTCWELDMGFWYAKLVIQHLSFGSSLPPPPALMNICGTLSFAVVGETILLAYSLHIVYAREIDLKSNIMNAIQPEVSAEKQANID